MSVFVQRGGLWVIAQFVLMGLLALAGVWYRGASRSPVALTLGVVLLGAGAGLALASALALGRGLTPYPQPAGEATLVRSGVYSLVRHPIYASLMAAGFGWALAWQSWSAFALAAVLVPFFHAKATREERWLRARFPDYGDYAKRVRRFIPWVY